jgi:hypothetical protein
VVSLFRCCLLLVRELKSSKESNLLCTAPRIGSYRCMRVRIYWEMGSHLSVVMPILMDRFFVFHYICYSNWLINFSQQVPS